MKMKLLPLFLLFFFILLTQAQRRTTAKTSTEPSTTRSSVSRGRGRSRFVTSVEYQNVRETSSTPESVPRKTVTSRRRVVENVEQRFPSRSVSTPSPTPSKPAITFTVNSERRALAPTFGDTVEKIFTVNESPIKRTSKPAAVPQISARRTPKPLTDYVERKNFKSTKNTYEVQEVINEDFELVRRVKKPRVLIESTNNQVSVPLRSIDRKEFFRTGSVSRRNQENADSVLATKFPKRTKDTQEGVLNFPPRKLENLEPPKSTTSEAPVSEEPINNISNGNLLEEQPLDTTLVPVEFESSPDPLQAEEVKEELTNVNLVSSTSKPIEEPRSSANRRNGLRKNTNVIEQSTAAPRFRTRGRSSPAAQAEQSSRAPEFNFQSVTPTATPNRGFRRRLDTITEPRKGPSVFSAETQFPESRSRTGRKIDLPTPEKLTLEIPTRNRRRTTTPKINKESSMPTFPSRNRFRSREMPIIDEQKLEVLPLFEVEPKLVNTRVMNRADVVFQPKKSKDKDELMTRKINDIDARSRRRGGLELIQASSTEIKSTEIPARSRVAVSVSVETRTESSVRRSIPNRRSEVKESVVSEINEVTSRKKVSRKKVNSNSSNEIKIKPLPVYRGSKKSDVVVKKGSSEEVDESDNYPEAFKALIKSKKESRPVPSSLPLRASNVVTSVPSFSTTFHPSTFKEVTDSDNEIKPKALPTSTSSRWNRSRSTTTSSVKLSEPLPPKRFPSRTSPYTTSEPISEKRFPSRTTPSVSISTTPIYRGTKLRTLTPRTFSAPPKLEKSVSFKPRSSVAEKNIEIKQFNRNRNAKRAENPVLLSTKVPKYTTTAKKLDRGKYRSEYSSRGSTTTAPKYIPTIPSVPYIPTIPAITPVRTMVDTSNQKDHDDGIHVISIDEPVNALQSANLVKGDFVSSTANSVSDILPLVNDGTTEKTVSIIERIINSISARSTTPPSSGTPFSSTASTTESPSAILKLSPKKSRQTDLTDSSKTTESNDTVPFTTENPTTIIEKILSSLNAIQATDITSAGQDDQNTIPSVDVKSNRVAASTTQATTSSTKAQTTITQSPITTTEAKSRTTLSEISTTTPPITSTSTVTPSNTQTTIMSKAEPTTIPSTIPLETSNTSSLPFSTEQSSTTSTSTLPSTTVLNSNTVTLPQDSINASTLDLESTKLTATESSTNTLSTSDSSTAEPDLVVVESITVLSTTMGSNSVPPTFPTLSEILNDKTLEAFNEIVSNSDQVNTNISNQTDNGRVSKYIKVLNIQDLIKGRNSEARSRGKPISIKVGTTIPISNEIVSTESSSTIKSTMSTEQAISTTTNTVTSTTSTPEVTPLKSEETSTEDNAILSNKILDDTTLPAKPTPFSAIQKIGTTRKLTPTTITPIFISTTPSVFPTFLTTFFPNLFPDEATRKPKVSTSSPGVIRISAAPSVTQTTFTERPVTTTQAVTTTRPTTTTTTTTTTTNAPTTTTRPPTTTKIVTTTTPATTITTPSTTPKPTTTTTIPTTPQPTTTTRMTTSPTRVTLGETVTVSTTGRTDAITDFNTIEVTTTAIKLKGLSSEQKNNLREIAQLEKEQAALLQQLSFLTNLGLGQNRGPKSVANDKTKNSNANPASSLAERILALAVQRDKNSKSTSTVATTVTTSSTTKLPTSIQDQIAALETTKAPTKATPVLEEVLKQYNLNGLNVAVTSPTSTVYGKSEDAILASLLKEQGIVPSTPAVLAGVFDETTIRPRRPKATTPQPGPIMRGLNWLLNTLAPTPAPATKRPTPKPVKPNKPPVEEELLVNSPTHMTPIATAAPSKIANALSQEDIKKLINQLEDIQKNPSKGTLDLSQIKSIQNLINLDGGVVVSTNGEHGTTSRITTTQSTTPTVQTTQRQPKKMVTLPTEDPLSAISSSEDGFGFDSVESTTRTLRAPVGFNPVPGVDDGSPNPLVQSNLITAAVNVTKAISNFLGTALQTVSQGAAASFQTLFGVSSVGTRVLGSASGGSSAG
ncbi:mucin-17-like isoform X7 [Diabrotica virgifera virgifera]|uniref:Mucin-5AC-like n=1 Tax=Diabrotica virgifera virgifera TaxID=50390 RepID=A0ABM5JUN5_DIAVI|nr:mucin-17-like isoform X7 [Diabrotica virgifera virgifera]